MAELTENRARNQTFLQEQERLRMSKPSNLAIDLRNKVVGECQPYQFGGVTHYLDDRGYLLAKRLLERYDGRYTIGVYELLHKAIKALEATADTDTNSSLQLSQSPLICDADSVQMLTLDKTFTRQELRILYATDVTLHANEFVYHGSTLDISCSAIRVSTRRAYTLKPKQNLTITFSDFAADNPDLFTEIDYRISHIQHDKLRTHLILSRTQENVALNNWFQQWTQQYKSLAKVDVEHDLFNIAHAFYLRLYLKMTKKPLVWFSPLSDSNPMKAIHLNNTSEQIVESLRDQQGNLKLALLPFKQVVDSDTSYIAFIDHDDDSRCISLPATSSDALRCALAQSFDQIILLQQHAVNFDRDYLDQHCADLIDIDSEQTERLIQRFNSISQLVLLTDITESCRRLPDSTFNTDLLAPLANTDALPIRQPSPTPLHHHIQRRYQRYLIYTDVSFYLMDEHLTVTTKDVSEVGLSLELNGHFPVADGTIVRINFIRWQSKTTKARLTDIPYVVRRMQYWEGVTTIGLERNVNACGEKLNQFFANTIAENQDQLGLDKRDYFVIRESALFGEQVAQQMHYIPFYLGQDEDRKRVIQAAANTQYNQAAKLTGFWAAFSLYANKLSELIRFSLNNLNPINDFGVYAYIGANGDWQVSTDMDFVNAQQKSLFIHRAMATEQYHFFHCALTAIKSPSLNHEPDLDQQLSLIRRHSAHHIRQMREVIRNLSGVGDLTDITTIIAAAYSD